MKSYTSAVKTAVSLPDDLFERAERAAQRMGRSRSALYAEALAAYLESLENEDEVTAALNTIYDIAPEPSALVPGAAAGRTLIDAGAWEW